MDFIIGILFIIIIIFILINFASVSISNSQSPNNKNTNNSVVNFLNPYNQGQSMNNLSNGQIPSPMNANSPLALNKQINLEEQTYDYNKYFFV